MLILAHIVAMAAKDETQQRWCVADGLVAVVRVVCDPGPGQQTSKAHSASPPIPAARDLAAAALFYVSYGPGASYSLLVGDHLILFELPPPGVAASDASVGTTLAC